MTIHTIEVPENNPVFGQTTGAFARFGHAPAVRAHGLLFIAGQIGRHPDGTPAKPPKNKPNWPYTASRKSSAWKTSPSPTWSTSPATTSTSATTCPAS